MAGNPSAYDVTSALEALQLVVRAKSGTALHVKGEVNSMDMWKVST